MAASWWRAQNIAPLHLMRCLIAIFESLTCQRNVPSLDSCHEQGDSPSVKKIWRLRANNANNPCTFENSEEMVTANDASYSASLTANSASYSASLTANSASSTKKRLSREELKSLIISICSDWGSIEDIVKKSGKSTSYIRNVVIPLLLAEKSIVMLFPGTPRNPNQKYRIKE